MPLIRVNRESVNDRFSVLGFTVRTESPLFEIGIATDPALFQAENRAHRTRRNFYSSRSVGALRARRGEAVYLVPPDVLANFVGRSRLYFGLATYRENSGGVPDWVQSPTEGHMYVDLSGLTERGLRRVAGRSFGAGAYGAVNGHDPSLDWGGDAQPQIQPPASHPVQAQAPATNKVAVATRPGNGAATTGNGKAAAPVASVASVASAPYDDGFGDFPAAKAEHPPAATPVPPAGAGHATAQAYARHPRALEAEDDAHGIDGPVPDDEATAQAQAQAAHALEAPTPEYLGASRFAPAHPSNFRAVSAPREVNQIVIHITDGGSRIAGTIGWFQNPNQRNARGNPIHVSAHYVVGRDGEVVQMVRNNDVAWHANVANAHSIGIEHVANTRGLLPTEEQYAASARLAAWLCRQYGLPIDRVHVLGHAETDTHTTHTDCPNAVWDWDHYMECVREAAAAPATAQGLGRPNGLAYARAQEIIQPYYDPADPASALTCQNDAFSEAREEWFAGVPNTTLFPHSAICQLRMTAPDGSRYIGTGFYIGANRILTCAHNLDGMQSVTIIPGRNGAENPFGECTVNQWRIARPPYTGDGNWENDLAVIDNVPLAAPGGQWFEYLNATPSDRLPIVVCGYAKRSVTIPELTQVIDGDKQHLHGGYAASQSNGEVIEYPILTLKGNSGSPVYHLDNSSGTLRALVCAVHVTGEPAAQGLNRGCFITPNKIDWIEGRATAFALGTARALDVPLDPGEGGRSIGLDALQPADIIVSTARHPVSYAIRLGTISAIGHAMLYVGDGKVIEAIGSGVREVPLATAIGDAILAVAYRHPSVDASHAQAIVDHARSRVGSPYNYAGVAFTGYRITNPLPARVIDALASRLGTEVGQAGAAYCSELVFESFTQGGLPLVASAPGASTPDDIVRLTSGLLQYVGHLKGEDVPFGIPLSLAQGRGAARALSQSFSLHWDDTPYQPQSTENSCWAATGAMVVGWRDRVCIPDSEIAAMVPVFDAFNNGLPPSNRITLAEAWNLVAEPPASYSIEGFRQMLANYGPLYVGMRASAQGGGHARVLVGMESGGAEDGSDTTMFLYDPWPGTPGRIRMAFGEFVQLYEGRMTTTGGVVDVQILHADGAQGRSPATAAPFSLSLAASQLRAPGEARDAVRPVLRAVPSARPPTHPRALSDETTDYPITLIPQPNKLACWAAAMAMLLSFRRHQSIDPETLAREVGSSLMTSYGMELLQAVRDRYGFAAIEMPSNTSLYFSPAQWAQWLRDFGPLWVVIVGMPHAVIVSGLRGNTGDANACQVRILNPWDTRVSFDEDPTEFHPANQGYADWLSFQQFTSDFGNMAEPDYGNWRVLHLPAQGASAQGLAYGGNAHRAISPAHRLAPPPRPVRAMSLEDTPPADEPIDPSRVPGTTMRRQRGSHGRVTWALDQLDGVKLPDPAAMAVPALVPTTITLAQWPCIGQDAVPLPLTVRFDAGGGAVGNVRIGAGTAADTAYDVTVTATIEDDAQSLPGLHAPQAALRVTIDYDFTGAPGGDASARVKLRLIGNGRYDLDSSWQ